MVANIFRLTDISYIINGLDMHVKPKMYNLIYEFRFTN